MKNMIKAGWKAAGFGLILVLLAFWITPGIPVLAAEPVLNLEPQIGEPGTSVTVSGNGYTPGYYYYVFFEEVYVTGGEISSSGTFSCLITVPADLAEGLYEVAVMSRGSQVSSPAFSDSGYVDDSAEAFEVSFGESLITLDRQSGMPGSAVNFQGSGFAPGTFYYLFFDEELLDSGSVEADGGFSGTLLIPERGADWTYEIAVKTLDVWTEDADYNSADFLKSVFTEFKITAGAAALEITPDSGGPGASLSYNGTQFTPGLYYYLFLDDRLLAQGNIDSRGEFSGQTTLPEQLGTASGMLTAFSVNQAVTDPSSETLEYIDSAEAYFDLIIEGPVITAEPDMAAIGASFSLSGSGFNPGAALTAFWGEATLGPIGEADQDGVFAFEELTVPDIPGGEYILTVMDSAGLSAECPFYLTPELTLSQTRIQPGDRLTVRGRGFTSGSTLFFYLDETETGTPVAASSAGSLDGFEIATEDLSEGPHSLTARDSDGYTISVEFTVFTAESSTVIATSTSNAAGVSTAAGSSTTGFPVPTITTGPAPGTFPVWVIVIIAAAVVICIIIIMVVRKRRPARR